MRPLLAGSGHQALAPIVYMTLGGSPLLHVQRKVALSISLEVPRFTPQTLGVLNARP
jgi:hypothetical protein